MPTDQLTLPEPFTLPDPVRVDCDVSPEPWTETSTVGDPGRQPMRVPRELAVRVHTNKNLAGAQVSKEFPFGTVLAEMTKATAPHRQELLRLDDEYRAAREAGASDHQLQAISGLQLAPRQQAQRQLQAAVQRVVQPVRETLASAERSAMQELEQRPSVQPSAADYSAATEIAQTLDLLPAPFAAKVLMQRLVLEPARTGKVGLTAAALPLLRGKMKDAAFENSPEYRDVLDLCQIVCRDEHYHASHLRLRTAGTLRHKVDRLAEDAGQLHGDAAASANAFYREFGASV